MAGHHGVPRRRCRRPRPQRRHRVVRPDPPGGPSGWASKPTSPRRWCAPRPGRRSRSPACCSPDRPTIRTASSATHRSTRDARAALANDSLSFADFLRGENLVLRADLLRPWANWVTPKEERTRRYDTYFFVARCRRASAPTATTPKPTGRSGARRRRASTTSPRAAPSCCRRPGRSWTRSTAAPSPRSSPSSARSSPWSRTWPPTRNGNWEIEFFNSDRYNEARNRRAPDGYTGPPLA